MVLFADEIVERRIAELRLDLSDLLRRIGAAVALEGNDMAGIAVKDALEVPARSDWPCHRIGPYPKHVLDLLHKVEGVAGVVVELVHEREDRDMAEGADLEELDRLRLDALGAVDDHDSSIGSHEGTVGILREVLVARGIEDVDAVALIRELEDGGRDGDAALLLDVHPVGYGMLRA